VLLHRPSCLHYQWQKCLNCWHLHVNLPSPPTSLLLSTGSMVSLRCLILRKLSTPKSDPNPTSINSLGFRNSFDNELSPE
jgi:hypothetical protein